MRNVLCFVAVTVAALASTACGTLPQFAGPTELAASAVPPLAGATPPLVGPTWRLVSLDGRAVLPGTRVTAVFADGDRVAGKAGCNSYFGRATATDAGLDVSGFGATRMYCAADGVMAQETAYLAALDKVAAYRIVGNGLRLGPAPGVVTLVFEAE